MSDIFISYASADREKAKVLAEALHTHGWSVWWDRVIPPGRQFDEVIEEALDAARCVIVLWSQASISSTWVKTEAADAMRRKILIPVLIENVKIPLEFRRLQAADLSNWTGDPNHPDLDTLLHSLTSALSGLEIRPGPTESPSSPKPVPVESPQHANEIATNAIAQLSSLKKPKVLLSILAAAVLIAVVVGVLMSGGGRDINNAPGKDGSSTNAQTSASTGAWLADTKGCKVWDPDPKPKTSITWSGSCLKGKFDGAGTAEWVVDGQKITRVTGRFSEGKTDGAVTVYDYASGVTYEGNLERGQPVGKGTWRTAQVTIEANFVDGKMSGNMIATTTSGERYEGAQDNGVRNGRGLLTFADGTRYAGNFVNGKFQGHGTLDAPNGLHYDGAFQDGKMSSKGTLTLPSGDRYVGDFVAGKYQGYGVLTAKSGKRYEGDFKDGQRTGNGIETFPNGDRYVGQFADGRYHGHGVMTTAKGQRYEGNFIAGQLAR